MKNIIIILGTRPEAIKLAPIILRLCKNPRYKLFICNTGQQKELSAQTLGFFGIRADFDLDVMCQNQTLEGTQAKILTALSDLYSRERFDATIVQGDTMSVLCGALVSFYRRIPVFHIEAGLRSYDLSEPFPEEAIRQIVSRVADLHFVPTKLAAKALKKEGIYRVVLSQNSVIDALNCLSDKAIINAQNRLAAHGIILNDKLVLITAHRRENHGDRLDRILSAVVELSGTFPDHQFVLPVHPNPNVYGKVHTVLGEIKNVVLTPSLDYAELVCVMKNAKLILTDSGGIQEEAPTFGVPVFVMRYETERTEGIKAGFAKLVGADRERIIKDASRILSMDKSKSRLQGKNPYGDGYAAKRIETAIEEFWK
ncbi:MAG: UDP-N-acetylglucosamine 2-epimerase (non-hydrolyzing) [Campylobacteraceae bacterium]|jgi:UDP-N-acetylglucosamine 2-epimerase (non-hydrolysing)|nr:UDP-N-acetylglucosamine 2-epimerase (non-hydrolyzing) [Campylobacteraceae bacterium]